MEEQLKQIINHYGVMKQLKYIHSEYFELDEAIMKYESAKEWDEEGYSVWLDDYKNHIAEEIADVIVMLYQFIEYYELDIEYIAKIKTEKVERQLKRIEEECKEQETKQNLKE